jgi:hypothetical protein
VSKPPARRISKRTRTQAQARPRDTAADVAPKPLARARTTGDSHLVLSPKASQAVLDALRAQRRTRNAQSDEGKILSAVINELTNR